LWYKTRWLELKKNHGMAPPPTYTDIDEAKTRLEIDRKLEQAGWVVQDKKKLNLHAALGVAVREMDTDTGPADYMLFIDGKACGVIEAKREGRSLGEVVTQSHRYAISKTKFIQRWAEQLPFTYEATNHEIRFCDWRDPFARSRYVFHFHKPETLKNWLEQSDTFRSRLQHLPELHTEALRACQVEAIGGLEKSLAAGKPRALLQMATGSGKTFTAVTEVYRLAKYAKAKRVLFLVDRGNLGRQALKEFQQYTVPDDGRKFTDLYNAHILGTAGIGDEIKVTISTIQRLYSQLSGTELDDDADERSGYEIESNTLSDKPRDVRYNPHIPIEAFDVIIIDECHRSIYNLWSQVLDYFDAFLIGLTATPTKKTLGYFHQNLVSEYTHEDAVCDKVNVGYDIYRIKTAMGEQGNTIEAGTAVQIRDRLTKEKRLEMLDEDEIWLAKQLDRSVIAPNQVRTVIQAFKDNALKDCFPERTWVPKTLIFAKDDDHADRIVDTVREVFNESNDFCKKVTYRVGKQAAENTIAEFRTSPRLRVAVTVDMIATGTDIKPLECLIFMRDVKSQAYYEQMKGRGTRVLGIDELHKVTPDAKAKTRFVLVDAVGVTETDKTETVSLESKPSVPTHKLMEQIARGDRDPDTVRTLGNRLIRLDLQLNDQQRKQISELAGVPLAILAGELIHAANPDANPDLVGAGPRACPDNSPDGTGQPQGVAPTTNPMIESAIKPFHNPALREKLDDLRRTTEQLIDHTADEVVSAGYDEEKAKNLIKSFQQFMADHKAELGAIQLIYSQPYNQRHLNYAQIEKLAEEIEQPPYNLAPIEVWKAYEQLEKSRVAGAPPVKLLTNIVSLIYFATNLNNVLEPFPALVERRFADWLQQQNKSFSPEQLKWLQWIKEQIASNAEIRTEDFEYTPFNQEGGLMKARALFGAELPQLISELNGYLIA
jgi:type I restriction enzyme R subunit